ncbi:MAG: enoyl-CoA hydratase [Alteromonas sp.]|jgi:isohexenylglutaconyl-CoA hydratase|uniref:Isohexenylglutaconyl-CoA hydratase n=1 Tax=Paraglaciecola chathamensis TaxID=368405 RepID=A0A8H9M3B9_9ALTE|nr:enoyl-CoA hydratase-related protein [Paraglaciecola oceanifecundans]MAI64987.1 enoyl-CoA hydratase [Alteromonas sp.]GGZ83699.1 isohexenylglutaconyl-CoA hydratase [Paraglaciecola oceanifecundans]|tara:strand:+ start:6101 stop:6895 length:795 start_codon:yes stop_codon:yes gene_type:complete
MKLPHCQELITKVSKGVLYITLNRPHKKNAMNLALVNELISVVDCVKDKRSIRVIVIRGAENNFCSGGDISGMNFDGASETHDPMWLFNRTFGKMITLVNSAPQVVVTVLEGVVLGGGIGLACISDVAIADINTKFAMPETRLGIVPAQIAPFVVSRIGLMQTRRLTLLGESIYGEEAKALGFVHYVTQNQDELETQLKNVIVKIMLCAPEANALTKKLILQVGLVEHEQLLDEAASYFCNSLKNEGKEGTAAFLEKRSASWIN